MSENLLEIEHLKQYFPVAGSRKTVKAVDDVSFFIRKGETFGLVGESGCGKTTTGRSILRLTEPTAGKIVYDGNVIFDSESGKKADMLPYRRKMQIVFQDPYSCLNPRLSVSKLIAEPLIVNNVYSSSAEVHRRVEELMDIVGLARRLTNSYPHELDGGRRQRIGIARSLALSPEFIVLDEPVSALDVCIQAQVLNLLSDLKKEFGYTYVFISHNLSVVKHVSDRIAVMYLGQIVELSDFRIIFKNAMHPYTMALLSAIPVPRYGHRRKEIILEGDVPSPINPPEGCRFAGRCIHVKERCTRETPKLREVEPGHFVRCHFAGQLA